MSKKGLVINMAFWDDITKGAKDAANYTVKKTEELTSIAKLKIALRGEESKLDDCFEDIGELYYLSEKNGADNAAAIAELIKNADDIKSKIAELKASLADVQGNALCEMCGASFDPEYRFCPKCGAEKKARKCEKEAPEEKTEE